MNLGPLKGSASRASKRLNDMSHQHRPLILCQLAHGEMCVGDLEELIGLSQSALTQHLARRRRDELVKTRRSAQTISYSLAGDKASAVIETLYALYCGNVAAAAFGSGPAARKVAAVR